MVLNKFNDFKPTAFTLRTLLLITINKERYYPSVFNLEIVREEVHARIVSR